MNVHEACCIKVHNIFRKPYLGDFPSLPFGELCLTGKQTKGKQFLLGYLLLWLSAGCLPVLLVCTKPPPPFPIHLLAPQGQEKREDINP